MFPRLPLADPYPVREFEFAISPNEDGRCDAETSDAPGNFLTRRNYSSRVSCRSSGKYTLGGKCTVDGRPSVLPYRDRFATMAGNKNRPDNRVSRLTSPGSESYFTRLQSGNRLCDKREKLPQKFYVVIDAPAGQGWRYNPAEKFGKPIPRRKALFFVLFRHKISPRAKAEDILFIFESLSTAARALPRRPASYLALYFIHADIFFARSRYDKFPLGGPCTTYPNVQ